MNRSGVILTICAGILLAAASACGASAQETVEETEIIETPTAAVTNGTAAGNERAAVVPPAVAAPTSPAAPTPTAFALTLPPPKIVTATPVAAVDVEQVDCGVFESAEDAHAYFLTEGGGPLDDPYSLDTNRDGIACNATTDAGAEFRAWDFEDSDGPGPGGVIQPTPTVGTTTEPVAQRERLELWEVDWTHMQDEGIVRIVQVGDGLTGQDLNFPYDECGPNVGTEPTEENRMFNPRVRAGWLWVDVPESDGDYCVGGYWSYETEIFPMPIYPPRRGYEQRRYDITGRNDEIVFRVDYEWRNYDVPPEGRPVEAVRLSGSATEPIPHEDPEKRYVTVKVGGEERVLLCRADMLPAAIWTFEEGFVPLTLEEEQAYSRLQTKWTMLQGIEWNEETAETKRAAEALGWYVVLGHSEGSHSYCFHLANQKDLPDTTPCLECYERK